MKTVRLITLCAGLVIVPGAAYANIGVPMIFLTLPGMLIALIPVIAIESYILSKHLTLALGRLVKATSLGNLISTIVGIPAAWLFLVGIQLITGGGSAYGLDGPFKKFLAVTWQAPWLIPYEPELYWMIPAATLTLLVPFFFASWWVEYQVEKRVLKEVAKEPLNRAVRNANLVSYGIFALLVAGFLITAKPGD